MKKIFVSYDGYMAESGVAIIEENTIEKCIMECFNLLLYGLDDNKDHDISKEELFAILNEQNNGDGCAYIISIISSEGELLFSCNDVLNDDGLDHDDK